MLTITNTKLKKKTRSNTSKHFKCIFWIDKHEVTEMNSTKFTLENISIITNITIR